jgi:hypothetical protein
MKSGYDWKRAVACKTPLYHASRVLKQPSSYLDEIPRITAKKYIPTDGKPETNSSVDLIF